MSNTDVTIPKLKDYNLWVDYRNSYIGGFGWRADRPLDQIKFLVIHHSVSNPSGNANTDISAIAREHITNRQWGGIGYNLVITSEEVDGMAEVAYVGDLGSVRAHTPNEKGSFGIPVRYGNYYTAGICIVGNFVGSEPSAAQLRSLHRLCYALIFQDGRLSELKDWSNVKTHKDFDYTACAGDFEKYKDKIVTPPSTSTTLTFEQELAHALAWKETILSKYGINLQTKVDNSNVTREQLLVILKRYTDYLQKSPNV